MIIFLTVAIVYSKGVIFFEKSFLVVGIILFALSLASYRFPKYFGLPFVLVAGFLVIAFAFSFLRFPLADEMDPLFLRDGDSNNAAVRIMRPSGAESSTEFVDFQLANLEDPLTIEIYEFHIDEALPLIGGQVRGAPVEIMQNDALIFVNPMIRRIPFLDTFKDENKKSIIKIKEYQQDFLIKDL